MTTPCDVDPSVRLIAEANDRLLEVTNEITLHRRCNSECPRVIKPHITRESGRWVVYLAGHQYASFRRFSKLVDCFEDRAPKYFDTLLDGLRERDVIGLFDRPILKDRLGAPRSIPSVQFSPEVTALIASQNLRLAGSDSQRIEPPYQEDLDKDAR